MNETKHQVVIVGAGMAGLAAAAYLSRANYDVLLIEKNKEIGGLVNTGNLTGNSPTSLQDRLKIQVLLNLF